LKAEHAVALDCLAVLLGRSPSALAEELSHSGQLSVLPQQIDVGSPEQQLRRRRTSPPPKGGWRDPQPKPAFPSKICFQG